MKPCSAYCEPEKGVHVVIGWTDAPVSEFDALRFAFVGRTMVVTDDKYCFPVPAQYTVVSIDPAVECNEIDEKGMPTPVLTKVAIGPVEVAS